MKQEAGYFQTPAVHVQRPVEPQGKNMPHKTASSLNRDDVLLLLYLSSFIIEALKILSLTEVACFIFPINKIPESTFIPSNLHSIILSNRNYILFLLSCDLSLYSFLSHSLLFPFDASFLRIIDKVQLHEIETLFINRMTKLLHVMQREVVFDSMFPNYI